MHQFSDINWLAVVVATASSFALGGLWYGPLFGKAWMGLSGMTKEKGAEANMAVTYGGTFALNLLIAIAIALLTGPHSGWQSGLHTGLFASLFFVATSLGVIYLFEQQPIRLWLINAGYQVVNFCIMGSIIGAWR
jgi:Protein of unknown function (DUF1761)